MADENSIIIKYSLNEGWLGRHVVENGVEDDLLPEELSMIKEDLGEDGSPLQEE